MTKKSVSLIIVILIIIIVTTLYHSIFPQHDNQEAKTLNVYTWLDFIPPSLQKKFEIQTGIKLHIDYIDSDEGLDAKLLTGKSQYDLVYPSTPHIFRHIQLGFYRPLTLSEIPNIHNIDSKFLNEFYDKDKLYSIPYIWGTAGFAYDETVFNILFPNEEINSWQYMFDPEKLKILNHYGVASTASANELFGAIGFWNESLTPGNKKNYFNLASDAARLARPYWRVFLTSEAAIHALGSGEVSIAFMWNGDAMAAKALGYIHERRIQYAVPKEGAFMWIDSMAIPKSSTKSNLALQFINFMLAPEHMAEVTNYVKFANTSSKAKKFIHAKILQNPILYPPFSTLNRLHLEKQMNPGPEQTINRQFFKILVGY